MKMLARTFLAISLLALGGAAAATAGPIGGGGAGAPGGSWGVACAACMADNSCRMTASGTGAECRRYSGGYGCYVTGPCIKI
jgi:hypothetical protein